MPVEFRPRLTDHHRSLRIWTVFLTAQLAFWLIGRQDAVAFAVVMAVEMSPLIAFVLGVRAIRVRADDAGVHLIGPLARRTVPWAQVAGFVVDGFAGRRGLAILVRDGDSVRHRSLSFAVSAGYVDRSWPVGVAAELQRLRPAG